MYGIYVYIEATNDDARLCASTSTVVALRINADSTNTIATLEGCERDACGPLVFGFVTYIRFSLVSRGNRM